MCVWKVIFSDIDNIFSATFNMTKPLTVLKSCGPKLVPFFKTCTIFFVLFADTPAAETTAPWFFCIVKCLPIISLILFVLLNGMNITEYYRYSRRILIGLIFSCLGDACLVWAKKYFELGIACFAIAQICYARAFGWKPFNPYAGAVVLGLGSLVYWYLSTALHGIMLYMVAAYIAVICTMAWRAVARVQFFGDLVIKWTKLSGCFGALAFVISDVTLAIDRFKFQIPYAHPIIMVTYYAAQFGIALSVVDSQVDELIDSSKKAQKAVEIQESNRTQKELVETQESNRTQKELVETQESNGTQKELVETQESNGSKIGHVRNESDSSHSNIAMKEPSMPITLKQRCITVK